MIVPIFHERRLTVISTSTELKDKSLVVSERMIKSNVVI